MFITYGLVYFVFFFFLFLQTFENAVTVMYALGGSTNGVLHLLALAHEYVSFYILLVYLLEWLGRVQRSIHFVLMRKKSQLIS